MSGREFVKATARGIATLVTLPFLLSFWVRAAIFGRDRALEGSSQALASFPGILGQYLRRSFLTGALEHCDPSVTVEFGTLFSQAGARLDKKVYIGPRCHIGLVHVEQDVLLGAGVHIPSGGATHGTDSLSVPIREQSGTPRMVTIGRGSWIGSAAVILADVGCDSVVGAGAVVTHPIPDRVVAAGVPARVIKSRDELPLDYQPTGSCGSSI